MTFDNVAIITYNDENGNLYPVRDIKPIGTYQTGIIVDVPRKTDMDEIVSRKEYYGDNTEDLSYLVVEQNVVKLVEANFDLGAVKKIDIPIVESE